MARRSMRCATGVDLEQAQADGRLTVQDVDEIRRFADFLPASGTAITEADRARIYLEHYPEDQP